MDQAPRYMPGDDGPPTPSEAALRAAMDESGHDLAAGRTVPLQDVLRELESLGGAHGRPSHHTARMIRLSRKALAQIAAIFETIMTKSSIGVCLLALISVSACSVPPRKDWFVQDGLIWYDPPQALSERQRRALEIAREFVRTKYPLETAYRRYGGIILGDKEFCDCWGIQFTALSVPGFDPNPIYSNLMIFVDKASLAVVTTGLGQ